jgi:hypothetical protein
MARKIANQLIAAAKARAKPITPAAAKRIVALRPFSNPHRTMTRLATAGMARGPRAPTVGVPKRLPRRRVSRVK